MPLADEGGDMAKVVNCECGHTVRGETDDELVAGVEAHIRQDHPEMVGQSRAMTSSGWRRRPS
jgi:hypothetical protein